MASEKDKELYQAYARFTTEAEVETVPYEAFKAVLNDEMRKNYTELKGHYLKLDSFQTRLDELQGKTVKNSAIIDSLKQVSKPLSSEVKGMDAKDSLDVMGRFNWAKDKFGYDEKTGVWGDPGGLTKFLFAVDSASQNIPKKEFLNKLIIETQEKVKTTTGQDTEEVKGFAQGDVLTDLKEKEGGIIDQIYAKRKDANYKLYKEYTDLSENEFNNRSLGNAMDFYYSEGSMEEGKYKTTYSEEVSRDPEARRYFGAKGTEGDRLYDSTLASVQPQSFSRNQGMSYYIKELNEDLLSDENYQSAYNDLHDVVSEYTGFGDEEVGLLDRGFGSMGALDKLDRALDRSIISESGKPQFITELPEDFVKVYSKDPKWETLIKPAAMKMLKARMKVAKTFDKKFSNWVEGSQKFAFKVTPPSGWDSSVQVGYKGYAKEYLALMESLDAIQEDITFVGGDLKEVIK